MNALFRPDLAVILRWTVLLGAGWAIHWLFRGKHAGWRLALWRGLLIACVAMPLMPSALAPIIRIPIYQNVVQSELPQEYLPPTPAAMQLPKDNSIAPTGAKSETVAATPAATSVTSSSRSLPRKYWLLCIWALGAALAVARLTRLHFQLRRLRRGSRLADALLQERAGEFQAGLGRRGTVEIRVSDSVTSSFLCGLVKPAILLPAKLVGELSRDEMSALLAHEIAHLRRHDLFWCVGWQWARALLWFHPLVWKIPAAHTLACEQEADRLAADQLANDDFYRQLLARLALRILALPQAETCLALNANSQIAQRLKHLARRPMGGWGWKDSMAGMAMVGALFLGVCGCGFSQVESPTADAPAKFDFKQVQVAVVDEEGQPIRGARITPDGFRVKGRHSPDAYGWCTTGMSAPETSLTDAAGIAYVKYPVVGIPAEKEFTGAIIFSVVHPEFSTVRVQTFLIDGTEKPIRMKRGISLEVSGYLGADHQRVMELVPNLYQENLHMAEWQKMENGIMAYHQLSPGGHLIQLMGRLPAGEIVYSDTAFFTAETGKSAQLALEMKPGIRLEGRIDGRVPRPIKNGRVMVSVRPKEFPALLTVDDFYALDNKYGGRSFWHSYRPIAADGSFVFESVPPGEVDVVVLGDGFVSKSVGRLRDRPDSEARVWADTPLPQAFPLGAPVTKIEVLTEPSVTVEFTATTKSGKPIEGVNVGFYPSAFRMSGEFGWIAKTSEAPFRDVPAMPYPDFFGKTDAAGKFTIDNLPAEVDSMDVQHAKYQAPLQDVSGWRDRHIRVRFSPGEKKVMNLVMEPIGTDFIGSAR